MLLELQNAILKMVARGESLEATLACLCREAERLVPDMTCSVLSLDGHGRMHPVAAPSLPPEFGLAVDNAPIGPEAGSCGTAAYLGRPVAVTDIENDPRWANYKALALPLGLLACWSSPIFDAAGKVVGTFAFYYRAKRGPTKFERDLVEACVPLCMIAFERDQRLLEQRRLALTDSLTGLPNRAAYSEDLLGLPPTGWGLLLIDIDHLKTTNDTFGHGAGDELIVAVAERIVASVAPHPAFRLGGDEFAVIVPEASEDAIASLAQRILHNVCQPASCGGQSVRPSVTIGGALHIEPSQSVATIRQNADFALYHAKETARGGYALHDEHLGTAITLRLNAIRTLASALDEDRVVAFYQPIIRIDTGEVVGLEALCRILAHDGTVIPAAAFHEATKDGQAAAQLTRRMVSQVARDLGDWLRAGIPFQHVGINISAADFRNGQLSTLLQTVFGAEGVPLKHAILEVTESVYLGHRDSSIADEISALRAGGLKVALDDFGTGFASLTHLLTVPVDIIKIDKSFVDRLGPDDIGSGIIEGILHIARSLDIRVVAEGIETVEQAQQLERMGCLLGQGYLYSRPISKDAMTTMLIERGQHVEKTDVQPIPARATDQRQAG